MKIKFFQSLTIVFLSLGLSAQTEQMPTSKEDTFRINLKEKEILIIDKNQNIKKENVAPKYDINLDNNKDELKKRKYKSRAEEEIKKIC